jgi:hypothetical protein
MPSILEIISCQFGGKLVCDITGFCPSAVTNAFGRLAAPTPVKTVPIIVRALAELAPLGASGVEQGPARQFANRALWRSGKRFRPGDIK